jgi:arylsulfatase A-like enzyme
VRGVLGAATWRAALLAGAAAALVAGCSRDHSEQPPDLLLISLDTLRADRVGAWGYERDTSPFLDRVARSGLRYARVLAPSPHTAPSHMSAFTGLDPVAHGVWNARAGQGRVGGLSSAQPMLAELLSEAGYWCALVSEGGNVRPEMGFDRGYRELIFSLAPPDQKLREVEGVLRRAPRERPLHLFFHTYQTHAPYLPAPEVFGRFADRNYQGVFRERYDRLVGASLAEAWAEAARFLDPFDGMGPVDVAWLSDLYDEGVFEADALARRVVEAFERARADQRVLLAIFSDHGEEFMEHGLLGHRRGLYAELVHVPVLLRGPGLPSGEVVEGSLSLSGLGATLLAALGLDPAPIGAAGVWPLRAGVPSPGAVYGQIDLPQRYGRSEGIEADGWRLMRTRLEGRVDLELFRVADDPFDQLELGEAEPDRRAALLARLDSRLEANLTRARSLPTGTRRLDPGAARELSALGYAGD